MPLRVPCGLAASLSLLATGCARSPVESFAAQGFRGAKVQFVADSSTVSLRDETPRLRAIPLVRKGESPEPSLRAYAARSLSRWGFDCKSRFQPKAGSYDPRMGLSRDSDGWNVSDPQVLRNYGRSTGSDYLVLLDHIEIRRSELERTGAGATGKLGFVELRLDLSVIDAKLGKRVWHAPAQGRVERGDSLELLATDAVDIAVENFFTALPESRRWGCQETLERFR